MAYMNCTGYQFKDSSTNGKQSANNGFKHYNTGFSRLAIVSKNCGYLYNGGMEYQCDESNLMFVYPIVIETCLKSTHLNSCSVSLLDYLAFEARQDEARGNIYCFMRTLVGLSGKFAYQSFLDDGVLKMAFSRSNKFSSKAMRSNTYVKTRPIL